MNQPISFMSWVNDYLAIRRQAGYALKAEGGELRSFARFVERIGHQGSLTRQLAVRWASSSPGGRQLTAARRIGVLRPFARYCQQFDRATEVPPRSLLGPARLRLAPHIFSDAEIIELMAACDGLYPPGGLRGLSCATIFGLMASTGLRISEATALTRSDVDLEHQLLCIRRAKLGKSRWVPIHHTTARALQRYANTRDREPLAANSEAFFVFDYGRPASTRSIEYAFHVLRDTLKWQPRGDHGRLRLHDLRHNSEAKIIPSATSLGVGLPALRCEEAVPVLGIIRGSSGIA